MFIYLSLAFWDLQKSVLSKASTSIVYIAAAERMDSRRPSSGIVGAIVVPVNVSMAMVRMGECMVSVMVEGAKHLNINNRGDKRECITKRIDKDCGVEES